RRFEGTRAAGESDGAHARRWYMRTQQDHRGAAGFDAVVLQDEATGRAGDRGGGVRRYSNCAGEPAPGIFQLDEEYPGLDAVAAALGGTPHYGVVLRGLQAGARGRGGTVEMREMRIDKADAGSGCAGYLVQLGIVAVFDARVARGYAGLSQVLSDEFADDGIRHPVFLGGADDHAGDAPHGQSAVPLGVLA